MPNLVGIGLSQVPTNSMLGGMAYQDPDRVKIKKLNVDEISQINSEIADTAVDIFIYDTSKDSDGGAWRKRTTDTSWYNETLGTATRGTRREFPSVAVLVLSAHKLTIYDGDDPDLPMWMDVYQYVGGGNGGTTTNWHGGSGTFSSVAASNGIIICGASGGCRNLHFINDRMSLFYTPASGNYTQLGGISNRNDSYSSWSQSDSYYAQLVTASTNDVAMTVLPNAPIDDATGLPVPTIAVATDGGVSVIKDNRTVVDIRRTSDDDVHYVDFNGDRVIMFMELGAIYVATIPNSDQSGNPNSNWSVYGSYGGNTSGTDHPAVQAYGAGVDLVSMKDHTFATAGYNTSNDRYKGLSILSENVNSSGNGMVAWIRSDCNTGYMYGDIKGAFLSDTDATNLVEGDVLGGKGTFDDASYWNIGTSWTISGGVATATSGTNDYLSKNAILTTGARYVIRVTVSSYSTGTLYVYCGTGAPGLQNHYFGISGNGTYTMILDAYNTNFGLYSSGFAGVVDNVTVSSVVDQDRSVNGKDLGVIGTVTRSAVATGAELVAYSGWSDSNFLRQPYNADLNYGTGDFSVMGWIKMPDISQLGFIFDRASLTTSGGGPRIAVYAESSQLKFYTFDGASNAEETTSIAGYNNQWVCFVCNRLSNGNQEMYINGELKDSRTGPSRDVSNTADPVTTIGHRYNAAAGATSANIFEGSIALLRTSASTPSATQVKKMYEDEKMLFQENAKCTLYGSSDAVTALAYDEVTERLHVGTSAGRSDFQGLRRINNTTTAVTTAISAHDGFIVEQ